MEWKEVLCTLNNSGLINDEKLAVSLRLHLIRDEIFFPDYGQYGYVGKEPTYNEFKVIEIHRSLDVALESANVNRKLNIGFSFGYSPFITPGLQEIYEALLKLLEIMNLVRFSILKALPHWLVARYLSGQ